MRFAPTPSQELHPFDAARAVLAGGRWFALVCLLVGLGAGLTGCGPPTCWLDAIDVTYKYDTSCSDVGERRGTLRLQTPAAITSLRERHLTLTTQAQESGLFVEEVLLQWDPNRCPSPTNTASTPLQVLTYQRIVLAPNRNNESTVQRLLACEPIGSTPPRTLNTRYLFACRTGQSSNAACTVTLEPQ